MTFTSRDALALPTETPLRCELTIRPLLEPTPAVARFPIPETRQQEFAELAGLSELLDAARGDAEHPRDMGDGADGGELIADLERAIRNVERARTLLRLHVGVLRDLLARH